jgi:putative chitinase
MQLTADKLQAAMGCARSVAGVWCEPLNEACRRHEITTAPRLCAFLAQIGHESAGLSRLVEGLNYSADGLRRVWPSRFDAATAEKYARKPVEIANKVYAGRMGNGPAESGDGYRFRGRGPIQVTGRANYEAMSELVRKRFKDSPDFVENPDALLDPRWGSAAAAAYWYDHALNELADAGEFDRITRRINGGSMGSEDRRSRYERAKRALA